MSAFWSGKRVLLTGHTGFKGAWMSLWLKTLGAEVFGFALEPDTTPALYRQLDLDNQINSHIADIRGADEIARYVQHAQPDIVFHFAAQSLVLRSYRDTLETWQTNVQGTVNLLEALRKSGHAATIVAITTDKVYHNIEADHAYVETDRLGGKDPYSASKACTELAISSYRSVCAQENLPLRMASARAGNVIGGGDWSENRLVPDIARSLGQGHSVETRNPTAVRPWQHVLEPLSGYMALAEKLHGDPAFADAFNFGPSPDGMRTVQDVIKAALRSWPGAYHIQQDDNAPHEAHLLSLSIEKAQNRLNWHPRWSFDQSVARTIHWYKQAADGAAILDITLQDIEAFEAA